MVTSNLNHLGDKMNLTETTSVNQDAKIVKECKIMH